MGEIIDRLFDIGLVSFFALVVFAPIMIMQIQSMIRWWVESQPVIINQLKKPTGYKTDTPMWVDEEKWRNRAYYFFTLVLVHLFAFAIPSNSLVIDILFILASILIFTLIIANAIQELSTITLGYIGGLKIGSIIGTFLFTLTWIILIIISALHHTGKLEVGYFGVSLMIIVGVVMLASYAYITAIMDQTIR